MRQKWIVSCILLLSSSFVNAETKEFLLEIKDHLFFPSTVILPADEKVRLVIKNHDNSPEEFDSFDLNREKVIFGGKQSVIYIGPLGPGKYEFFGEYHSDTARGMVVVEQGENNAD